MCAKLGLFLDKVNSSFVRSCEVLWTRSSPSSSRFTITMPKISPTIIDQVASIQTHQDIASVVYLRKGATTESIWKYCMSQNNLQRGVFVLNFRPRTQKIDLNIIKTDSGKVSIFQEQEGFF